MKLLQKITLMFFIIIINLSANESDYIYPYNNSTPKEQFAVRREKLLSQFSENSILIFLSSDYYMNKWDICSKTMISQNQYYLSGMPVQKSVLILIPNGIEFKGKEITEVLLINSQNNDNIIWNGPGMSIENAKEYLGIDNILELSELDSLIGYLLDNRDTVFIDQLSHTKHFTIAENYQECDIEIINNITQQKPTTVVIESIPYINDMRQIKDNFEIELMQKAVDISIEGHKSAMKKSEPGLFEYQIQSFMESEFMFYGAERVAYTSIIGSGANSCYLHYIKNNAQTKNGDLVLMDCGAKYKGYCSDITRTFPISGKFSEEQKIIYSIVLEAMDSAFTVCKPGEKFSNIHEKAKELIAEKLTEQSILSTSENVDIYFPHGTSHFLGIDVHDVGTKRILEPGMVVTVEPGIYIPVGSNCDARWWNIGIRIEDDILITEKGFRNLSEKMPKSIEEIEALMK